MSVNDYEKKYLREREKNETSFQHIDELRNKMETEIGKYKSVVT